jgi:hypothetical protein
MHNISSDEFDKAMLNGIVGYSIAKEDETRFYLNDGNILKIKLEIGTVSSWFSYWSQEEIK